MSSVISAASRSRMASRSLRVQGDVRWPGISGLRGGFDDYTVLAIVLPHPHGDALATGRGQVLADVIRPDRQLTVPAIDEDRELDHAGPTEVDQRVERGPDRSAREEHVVDQDDRLALDAEGNVGTADDGSASHVEVVTVERDVQRADRQRGAVDASDLLGEPLGQGDAPRAQADERHVLGAVVLLEDLVRDASQSTVEGRFVEDFGFLAELRRATAHFRSLRASLGPLKGVHRIGDLSNSTQNLALVSTNCPTGGAPRRTAYAPTATSAKAGSQPGSGSATKHGISPRWA